MARNLRLLQIDDDITNPVLANAIENNDRVPTFIDPVPVPVDGADLVGITSWSGSIAFWSTFDPSKDDLPDLVTADVRFEDATSPLNDITNQPMLPTGISHFKAFAAMARITQRPIGYCVHTAEASYWDKLMKLGDTTTEQRAMALLAAHETAELAAILGDLPPHRPAERAKVGLRWLESVRQDDFGAAWPVALRNYRQSLLDKLMKRTIVILPRDWMKLAHWCESMLTQPKPITAEAGFAFVAAGRRDDISIRSLFADVESKAQGQFDFEIDVLPAECFKLEQRDDAAALDAQDLPRIGALVHAGRFGHDVFAEAIKCLKAYPITNSTDGVKLTDFKPDDGPLAYGNTARALAVVFQILRRDRMRLNLWRDAYEQYPWDHEQAGFGDSDEGSPSLRVRVAQLDRYLREFFQDVEFSAEQVSRSTRADDEPTPEWHLGFSRTKSTKILLEILVELGGVVVVGSEDKDADEEYDEAEDGDQEDEGDGTVLLYQYRHSNNLGRLPSIPASARTRLLNSLPLAALLLEEDTKFVETVFCLGDDKNTWRRQFAAGLGVPAPASSADGYALFTSIVEGSGGPTWIKTLARQYASDLGWLEADWPRMLR